MRMYLLNQQALSTLLVPLQPTRVPLSVERDTKRLTFRQTKNVISYKQLAKTKSNMVTFNPLLIKRGWMIHDLLNVNLKSKERLNDIAILIFQINSHFLHFFPICCIIISFAYDLPLF